EVTGVQGGATLSTTLYNNLVAALDPHNTGFLALVDASGNHLPDTFLQTYSNVQSYLKNASVTNMAYMLSAMLLTTELNIFLGKVDPTASIFVPAVTIPGTNQTLSAVLQNSLSNNSVSNPSGIARIQDLLTAAIAELNAAPNTVSLSPDRTFEEALKDCFD